jgi:alcohol dehydrogenase class IV
VRFVTVSPEFIHEAHVGQSRSSCDLRMHVGAHREMLFPGHVAHGDGLISSVGEMIGRWGVATGVAFVVSDRFLEASGMLRPLLDGLIACGWTVELFTDVSGEPTVADGTRATEAARGCRADIVLGVGGGSVLDLAKVAALLLANPGDILQFVGPDARPKPARPLVLIPTTTGTGAEATRVAVLSDDHGKRVIAHDSLVPLGVVLDATAVVGLPASITAATGMDALAHAIESTLSTSSSPLTASMSLRAAELMYHWLPIAYRDPEDLRARRATLYGAFLAGVALNAGVVLGHSMAYTVANRTKLAHGVTCAMALPYCLAYNSSAAGPDFAALTSMITGGSANCLVAAESLATLADTFGIPSTPVVAGIDHAEEVAMADECATVYPRPNNPVEMTAERLRPLYAAWFDGDLSSVARRGEMQ